MDDRVFCFCSSEEFTTLGEEHPATIWFEEPWARSSLTRMSALCDAIARELESGRTAEAFGQRWHAHARRRCDTQEFRTYWKAEFKDSFFKTH
jgi:hypothetical protein